MHVPAYRMQSKQPSSLGDLRLGPCQDLGANLGGPWSFVLGCSYGVEDISVKLDGWSLGCMITGV